MWRSYLCSNEWRENPDLVDSWGTDLDFKEDFDRGFQVGWEGRDLRQGADGRPDRGWQMQPIELP